MSIGEAAVWESSQAEIRWISVGAPSVDPRPRFRLLTGRVEFEYDPEDSPTGTLVPASEDPEVL